MANSFNSQKTQISCRAKLCASIENNPKLIAIPSKARAQQTHFNKAIALYTESSYRMFFFRY